MSLQHDVRARATQIQRPTNTLEQTSLSVRTTVRACADFGRTPDPPLRPPCYLGPEFRTELAQISLLNCAKKSHCHRKSHLA